MQEKTSEPLKKATDMNWEEQGLRHDSLPHLRKKKELSSEKAIKKKGRKEREIREDKQIPMK